MGDDVTTIKEYKAMMEQAKTDGNGFAAALASAMMAPDLIRVIELAEELTLEIQQKRHVDFDKVSYLREEIRKLKGE